MIWSVRSSWSRAANLLKILERLLTRVGKSLFNQNWVLGGVCDFWAIGRVVCLFSAYLFYRQCSGELTKAMSFHSCALARTRRKDAKDSSGLVQSL